MVTVILKVSVLVRKWPLIITKIKIELMVINIVINSKSPVIMKQMLNRKDN